MPELKRYTLLIGGREVDEVTGENYSDALKGARIYAQSLRAAVWPDGRNAYSGRTSIRLIREPKAEGRDHAPAHEATPRIRHRQLQGPFRFSREEHNPYQAEIENEQRRLARDSFDS